MLAKEKRLKKKKDFERVFSARGGSASGGKNSKTFKEGFLILKTVKNNLNINRFGFVISQKVSKKAVIRNKIKRRLGEIIRLEIKKHQLPKGFLVDKKNSAGANKIYNKKESGVDMIFIALPGIDKKNFLEIKESLLDLLKRAGINSKEL